MPTMDGRPPSEAVVEAVATETGADPTELEPLYEAVDPDSLDSLLARGDDDVTVEFDYEGFQVTVTGDGRVRLGPATESSL